MAILRNKDAVKLNKDEIAVKIKELRFELVKAQVTANKTKAKTKEIKRTLARLLSLNKSGKEELKNK